jgi:hypothetical protein
VKLSVQNLWGHKKSIHVKGWCGSGQVRSPGDFDGLNVHESWFLKPQASLASHGQTSKTKKKQKNIGVSV